MKSTEKSLIDANPEPYRMDIEFYDNIRAKGFRANLIAEDNNSTRQRKRIPGKQGANFPGNRGGRTTSCRRMSVERRLSSAGIP